LFAITTREEKKCDDNKLVAIIFFAWSRKKEKLGDSSKLVVVAVFATKKQKKKKAMAHLRRHLVCFKQKNK
jgi:hypothetical protein